MWPVYPARFHVEPVRALCHGGRMAVRRVLRVPGRFDSAAIAAEFGVPDAFPAEVLAEADRVAADPPGGRGDDRYVDAADLPLVTIDPPGARPGPGPSRRAGRW